MAMPVNIGLIKTLLSIYELLVGGVKNMATVLQTVSAVCCTGRPGVSNCCITVNAVGLRLRMSGLVVASVWLGLRVSVWGSGLLTARCHAIKKTS